MVMIGQHKRLSEPLRWTRGARIAVALAGVVAAAAVAAVIAVASLNAPRHRAGCIEMTFPSTLGGASMHVCGSRARRMCAFPGENPGLAAHEVLREACERERLPYGTAPAH